jgi:tyrosyl-tRNA synthetase
MANNHDWFGSMNYLEFMRDTGKHFSVKAMIKKASVQQRLQREAVRSLHRAAPGQEAVCDAAQAVNRQCAS